MLDSSSMPTGGSLPSAISLAAVMLERFFITMLVIVLITMFVTVLITMFVTVLITVLIIMMILGNGTAAIDPVISDAQVENKAS